MRTKCLCLFALTFLFGCAGFEENEPPSSHESLSEAEVTESSLGCPKPCVLSPTPPGFDQIQAKRNSLAPSLRDGNFARQTTAVTATPAGDGFYQFFTGSFGRGAIYYKTESYNEPARVHAVYGAMLDEWERLGFERGELGYPTSDEYDDAFGRRQRFTSVKLTTPDRDNACHIETERFLVWEPGFERADIVEELLYFDDNNPDRPSRSPQQVTTYLARPLIGPWDQHVWEHVWCGPLPPWWHDPSLYPEDEDEASDEVRRTL